MIQISVPRRTHEKSEISASKTILAKLMAEENISVVHQKTSTAYFDLKSRTIILPYWTDMDGPLYDLLVGHEVGHALFTPLQGWHKSTHDENGNPLGRFKGFLNVIEDARIEKRVKRRFPGLGKSFSQAYKSLHERDFFGIKNIDPNKLNLIDRINIRYKLGSLVPVSFSDEERVFLADIDQMETWEDAVAIAQRVFAYCKSSESQKINSLSDLKEEIKNQFEDDVVDDLEKDLGENSEDLDDDFDDSEDLEDNLDESSSGGNSSSKKDDEENKKDSENGLSDDADDADEDLSDDPDSVTDRSFRKRESELVNASGEVLMIELPEPILENIIIPNTYVMDDLEKFIRTQINIGTYYYHNISYDLVASKCVKKFNANNKKYIMHLYKEFEMRKKASEYARVQTAKTGELNTNVLHNYKFSSDIFKKISVVPSGKSHGMILFLDMSGSMFSIMRNTIEQLLVLASFCRLAKIPFDVYGFSDDWYQSSYQNVFNSGKPKFVENEQQRKELFGSDNGSVMHSEPSFHIKHLIGSSLSSKDYHRSFANLCIVVNEYYRHNRNNSDDDHGNFSSNWTDGGFGLNATPFQETLITSRKIINDFRKKYKLDITNVIYLTDGDGGCGIRVPWEKNNAVLYLIDKDSKKKIKTKVSSSDIQASLTQLVRDVTGCKHIGFYLVDKKSAGYILYSLKYKGVSIADIKTLKKEFSETNTFSAPNLGYDKYFYIGSSNTNITETKLNIDDRMTKTKMTSEFKKSLRSKKSNRALVTQFAQEIATHL